MYPNLEDPVNKSWFEHTTPFIKKQCYRIYNEIENSYYSFNDVILFLIYKSIWDMAVKLVDVNGTSVDEFKSQFSKKQLMKDREVINDINKKAGYKHISEYFVVRENGESIIYRLCIDKLISIYFFACYSNNSLTGFYMRKKIKERSDEYAKFVETIKILINKMSLPIMQAEENV
jgi:hypothetical protein